MGIIICPHLNFSKLVQFRGKYQTMIQHYTNKPPGQVFYPAMHVMGAGKDSSYLSMYEKYPFLQWYVFCLP